MLFPRTYVFSAALFALSSCAPDGQPTVEQSPEQSAVAETLHSAIVGESRAYVRESGVKAMAACLAWQPDGAVTVAGVNWYYYPTALAYRNRPIDQLARSAVGRCQTFKNRNKIDCECQLISRNGDNAIVAPVGVSSETLSISFDERGYRSETSPYQRELPSDGNNENRPGPIAVQ